MTNASGGGGALSKSSLLGRTGDVALLWVIAADLGFPSAE